MRHLPSSPPTHPQYPASECLCLAHFAWTMGCGSVSVCKPSLILSKTIQIVCTVFPLSGLPTVPPFKAAFVSFFCKCAMAPTPLMTLPASAPTDAEAETESHHAVSLCDCRKLPQLLSGPFPHYVLFTSGTLGGTLDPAGTPWCPDCAKTMPVIRCGPPVSLSL